MVKLLHGNSAVTVPDVTLPGTAPNGAPTLRSFQISIGAVAHTPDIVALSFIVPLFNFVRVTVWPLGVIDARCPLTALQVTVALQGKPSMV